MTWAGPRKAKILVIGEAWGRNEAELRKPFVGEAGKLLFEILNQAAPDVEPSMAAAIRAEFRFGQMWVGRRDAWLEAASVAFTNVFNLQPLGNDIEALCVPKKALPAGYDLPAIKPGHYAKPEIAHPELARLQTEILDCAPNLLVLLGNVPCWAVLRSSGISSIRGTITQAAQPPGQKSIASYHPAGVMRNWSWRPILLADMMKALREGESPLITRPSRQVGYNPTIEELEQWTNQTISSPPLLLSVDIETIAGSIKCIGFAKSVDSAMVAPLYSSEKKDGNYWPEQALEERCWTCCERLLKSSIPKLFQNGMYDIQYLTRHGFRLANVAEDTMLMHHSIFPELPKGLGFLGSIYTAEPAWKMMARRRGADVVKADE